jgi:hypothetical protein
MSMTTASGVSARSGGEAGVKRETCLSKTKLLLDIQDAEAAGAYKKLIADMGGEITKSSSAHVAVATSYTKTSVRVSAPGRSRALGSPIRSITRSRRPGVDRSSAACAPPSQMAKLQQVPVVTPDWLDECHARGFQVRRWGWTLQQGAHLTLGRLSASWGGEGGRARRQLRSLRPAALQAAGPPGVYAGHRGARRSA